MPANSILFEQHGALKQDGRGIRHSSSGAKIAWLKDPDGNIVSFSELSPG
jgi:hypothetical protein